MKVISWFALVLVLVLGCKSDDEKLVDKHKTKLKAKLDKIAALAPLVEKEPELAADAWPVPGVKWSENIFSDPSGNALWAWSHQLVDACSNRNATFAKDNSGMDFIILSLTKVSVAGEALRQPKCAVDGKMSDAAGLNEPALVYLENTKYLLVLRPRVKQVPELNEAERKADLDAYMATGKGTGIKHFVPGRLAGDALLYEIESAKRLGGFTFDIQSSDTVDVAKSSAGLEEMRFDLAKNLEKFLDQKFKN